MIAASIIVLAKLVRQAGVLGCAVWGGCTVRRGASSRSTRGAVKSDGKSVCVALRFERFGGLPGQGCGARPVRFDGAENHAWQFHAGGRNLHGEIAALAFSVSKMVSIRIRSAPPSIRPLVELNIVSTS